MKLHLRKDNDGIDQGDIYRDVLVSYIPGLFKTATKGNEPAEIQLDYFLILSPTCDIHRVNECKEGTSVKDAIPIMIIGIPLFKQSEFIKGTHLSKFGRSGEDYSKQEDRVIGFSKGEQYRFYRIGFTSDEKIVHQIGDDLVMDFRHFLSVPFQALKKENYICSMEQLYVADITNRFHFYLSRIGLP